MYRRVYLGAVGMAAIAGCTGGDGGEGGDGGDNSGDGGGGDDPSLPPPTLESHDVQSMTGGYELVVTMTNGTDQVLNRAVGEVAVYDGDTRLANARAAVIDLESGVTDSESALLEQFRPDDVTRYTITMSGETEEFEETGTKEHEFDGAAFRDRLSG
jgi:hypothetical protein